MQNYPELVNEDGMIVGLTYILHMSELKLESFKPKKDTRNFPKCIRKDMLIKKIMRKALGEPTTDVDMEEHPNENIQKKTSEEERERSDEGMEGLLMSSHEKVERFVTSHGRMERLRIPRRDLSRFLIPSFKARNVGDNVTQNEGNQDATNPIAGACFVGCRRVP
jgi:hypothetical protein